MFSLNGILNLYTSLLLKYLNPFHIKNQKEKSEYRAPESQTRKRLFYSDI